MARRQPRHHGPAVRLSAVDRIAPPAHPQWCTPRGPQHVNRASPVTVVVVVGREHHGDHGRMRKEGLRAINEGEGGASVASDHAPPPGGHPGPRPTDRAGTWVRATVCAVAGSLLALTGHFAVADGVPPWHLVTLLVLAQFAAAWPAARRRFAPVATLGCALGFQAVLHGSLAVTTGPAGAESGHLAHVAGPRAPASPAGGPAWHEASGTMTAVHVLAAVTVAWLLHRADTALVTAVRVARAFRDIARWVVCAVGRPSAGALRSGPCLLPSLEGIGGFAPPEAPRTPPLEHQLVRRGPPGPIPTPVRPASGPRLRPARSHPQGASPCPRTSPPARHCAVP